MSGLQSDIKCLLFDIDEVLIRPNSFYSDYLQTIGYENASEVIGRYYYGTKDDECVYGRSDPVVEIKPFLDELQWKESVGSYLNKKYAYEKQFIDWELLRSIDALRKSGYGCYLASDQDQNRIAYILEEFGFKDYFSHWFISSSIGHRKKDSDFWLSVTEYFNSLNTSPKQVLFIDDREENLKMAERFGYRPYHASDESRVEELKVLLIHALKQKCNKRREHDY